MKLLKMGLCQGRHDMPVERYVFHGDIKDITKISFWEGKAFSTIWGECYRQGFTVPTYDDPDKLVIASGCHLDLYVTGLTVALVAVINVCCGNNISLTLWHYDNSTGEYFPQKVLQKK